MWLYTLPYLQFRYLALENYYGFIKRKASLPTQIKDWQKTFRYTSSTRASQGRKFHKWKAYNVFKQNMPTGCHVTPGVLQKQFLDVLVIWHLLHLASLFSWHFFFNEIKFTSKVKWDQKRRDGANQFDKRAGKRREGLRRVVKSKVRRVENRWEEFRTVEESQEKVSWEEVRRSGKSWTVEERWEEARRGKKRWEVRRSEKS